MTTLFATLVLAIAVTLALLAWIRSGKRFRVGATELLRVGLIGAAVVLLFQPESVRSIDSDQTSPVLVLVDRSGSMQTRDVKSSAGLTSRAEVADGVVGDSAWGRLDERFEVVVESFSDQAGQGSDLAAALDDAMRRHRPVAAVLVSDGDWSGRRSPVEAAAQWSADGRGVARIDTVPIGSRTRLPDVELLADLPAFGIVDKPVRVRYTVQNWFAVQREVPVQLRLGDAVLESRQVKLQPGQRRDGVFVWRPERRGTFELAVEAPLQPEESDPNNNRLAKPIEIRPENLRVLVIESVPRWEYRFLRNALRRDPGIEVDCLLFHPALDGVGGGGEDYLRALPETPVQWAVYDVVFLGDVGLSPGQLTVEQCAQIRGLVEQQASGLVLMPGQRGHQAGLQATELAGLCPVVLNAEVPGGRGSPTPSQFALTQAGRSSLLTDLSEPGQANWEIWESLPGFYWHAAVERAKAGSEVLAVHSKQSNQYGRVPLLVTRPAGAGKVLFMGTDAAWRWRRGVEDKYHYRFWGQVIRWMAYQRSMAVGERMRLSYRPDLIRQGDTVSFRASLMTPAGAPLRSPSVALEIAGPEGGVETVRLTAADSQWGVYVGQRAMARPGDYQLTLNHPADDERLQTRLTVRGRQRELRGRPARYDVLGEVARVAGGQRLPAPAIGQLVNQLNALPPAPQSLRRIQWWHHPAVMFTMVAGLTVFWIARKWSGGI